MNPLRSLPLLPGSRRGRLLAAVAAALLAGACSSSDSDLDSRTDLRGTVTGPSGAPVAGATVYLVPSSAIPTQEITPAGVSAGSTEAFDEPLEDAVAAGGAGFVQATTASDGSYRIPSVPDGRFFLYAEPAVGDEEHFPGGNLCRASADAVAFRGATRDIVLSSSPPAGAQFVGMTTCLSCHPDYESTKGVAHRLGFRVPGVSSGLQDTSYHPEVDNGLAYFQPAASFEGGTPVYFYDPDFSRPEDAFKTSLTDPTTIGEEAAAILWLWRSGDEYRITIENLANPGDGNTPATRVVELTYGGAVQKQRYMIAWPGRNGLYALLQFQTQGDDDRFDRTRKVFRDYGLADLWNRMGTDEDLSDDELMDPSPDLTIQRNCMGCHAADYRQFEDSSTGEVLCTTLSDPNGEYDLDGDGLLNDLNVSCESCHGPGSAHADAAASRWIVTPQNLSPSRSNQLCGRCHDRQVGADPRQTPHPFSPDGSFPHPGVSRAELLSDFVDPDGKGPPESAYWPDFEHSSHNQQHYSDMVRSAHYRNPDRLLDCSACHNVHGGTGHPRVLVGDPQAPDTSLCMVCHGLTLPTTGVHTEEVLGVSHEAALAACTDCHMSRTAQSGSGTYGFLLSPPTGTEADVTETYYENDISSHLLTVPRKDNVGVAGQLPIDAMPIPFTRICGTCHDPSGLQDR